MHDMTAQYDVTLIIEYQILCFDPRCHYGLEEVLIIIGDSEDCAYYAALHTMIYYYTVK